MAHTDGGLSAAAWTEFVPSPGNWVLGLQFHGCAVEGARPASQSNMSCRLPPVPSRSAPQFGVTWSCGPPIDASGIDSAKACAGNLCIVGGGEISPAVAGWTHVSHDGGQTWEAARSLNAPFPIRSVLAVPTAKVRWRPALHCGCLPIPPRPILAPPGPNPPHCGWRQLLFKRRRHVQLCRWWCELDARCKHRWRGGEGLSSPAAACSARDSRVVRQCRPGQWGRLFSRRVGSGTAVIAPVQRKVLGRSPEGTLQAAWGPVQPSPKA